MDCQHNIILGPKSQSPSSIQHPPVEAMSSGDKSQSTLLWEMRTEMEHYHRVSIHKFATTHSYVQSCQKIESLPEMTNNDLIDTCNKSFPVYIRYRNQDNRYTLLRIVLHNYIYRRWFRPYRSDIESYRFLCKFITATDLPDDGLTAPPSLSVLNILIAMNKAICGEADAHRRSYAERLAAGDKNPGKQTGVYRPSRCRGFEISRDSTFNSSITHHGRPRILQGRKFKDSRSAPGFSCSYGY